MLTVGRDHPMASTAGGSSRSFEETDSDEHIREVWAPGLIAWFNSTLRPGESPRKLIAVTIEDQEIDSDAE